jgi:23S rRNA pseudouridine1911/1915/1917 synthase
MKPSEAGDPVGRYRLVVSSDHAGQRLDRWLADLLPALSRSRLKALIEQGQVTLESADSRAAAGRTITEPSHRVKPGQAIQLVVPPSTPAVPEAQDLPLTLLYEDADLLVLNKAAGMVVHPAPGNPDRTLVNALLAHAGDSLSGIGGVRRPGIVHRLDKDTSGVMVVAKNDFSHRALSEAFARHDMDRRYYALVWGAPGVRRGRIEGNIGRHPLNRQKMAVVKKGGKPATTEYRVLHSFGPKSTPLASLVECRLLTGRTHQVRVHMAYLGHALVGDRVYGRARKKIKGWETQAEVLAAFPRQALHAYRLAFRHPRNGQALEFETGLPVDMEGLISAIE